ncbi:MAG: homoserine kinase [Gemmatimonadaceae bacterium]
MNASSQSGAPSRPTPPSNAARAFAPGGIGNLGPGLDVLGCAVTGPGDAVTATLIDTAGVRLDNPGHPDLPTAPTMHASAIAATEVLRRAGKTSVGVALSVEKGLPLAGGQGGSAASGVAGALATNAVLGHPLDYPEILMAALVAEERVAGRHIDNLAPCLFGGLMLIQSIEPLSFVRLPVPVDLHIVLVHPAMRLSTSRARSVLPASVDRATAMAQAMSLATMVAAFCTGDLSLLNGAVDDRIAEPARAPLLPGFPHAKHAALDAGALGCSISGGGPSIFALADSESAGERIKDAIVAAYASQGLKSTGRVARVDEHGARVEFV